MIKFNNNISISRLILKDKIKAGDVVLDATLGNGLDTIYLAGLVSESGLVYGFDIQEQAIKKTEEKLVGPIRDRVRLIRDGHENIDKYFKPSTLDAGIYNLGYLPKGDKSITTKLDTTIRSIDLLRTLLKPGGLCLISAYPGHEAGFYECIGLDSYLKNLNQRDFNVFRIDMLNQKNKPPVLFGFEKIR